MTLIRTIYIAFICFFPILSFGQKKIKTSYYGVGYQQVVKKPKIDFEDSLHLLNYLSDLKSVALKKGFLLFSIDSIRYRVKNTEVSVFTYTGEKFGEGILYLTDDVELEFLKRNSKINEKLIAQTSMNPKEIAGLMNNIKSSYTSNGYPFAKISLEKVEITNSRINAAIKVERGPFLKWKAVYIKGDSTLSVKYLTNLLGIKIGDEFNEKTLAEVANRIKQVNFIEEIKPNEILFTNNGAELYLYLKSIPISAINGIIGFQPSPSNDKLQITGDVNLKLVNIFKRGELLNVRWQSIREQTQSLKSQLNYPFLFKSPFGFDMSFNLYKRDTTFLELKTKIGIQYHLSRGSFIKGYYESFGSNVLSGGANNPSYSKLGNVKNNMYGLAFSSNRIDYMPNPSRGLMIYLESSAGNRINRLNDTSAIVKSLSFKGEFKIDYFIPITKRHVIRLANQTEYYSVEGVFQNELFRFGGLNSQRGFNEDVLIASTRSTSMLEYRFLLDKNSHVFLFGDVTWYENTSTNYIQDTPYGFGAGFSFSTNLGVFSISYALGKQLNNPILFSDSKIHFGYIFYF